MTDAMAKAAEKAADEDKPQEGEDWGGLLRTVVYAVLIAVGFRTIAFEPFSIPSESMVPTLLVGDYLLVSKYSYGYSRHSMPFSPPLFSGRILKGDVARGDVAVFKLPRDNATDYIKRVIGLPGDRVQVRGGQLYINGEAVLRERVADFEVEETPNTQCKTEFGRYRVVKGDGTIVCKYPQFRETMPNGRSYMTLDLYNGTPLDDTREWTVPEGHYFMMGDNRDASLDSRRPMSVGVGFVPAQNLVGRAEVIFFSTDGSASLWPWTWFTAARYERFFNSLR